MRLGVGALRVDDVEGIIDIVASAVAKVRASHGRLQGSVVVGAQALRSPRDELRPSLATGTPRVMVPDLLPVDLLAEPVENSRLRANLQRGRQRVFLILPSRYRHP